MVLKLRTEMKLKEIARRWDWQNLDYKWTILQGAYCRLSWVEDGLPHTEENEEYRDILKDTMEIIEALQTEIKTKETS